MMNRMNWDLGNVTSDAHEMVENHPVSTLLVAFGLGITTGLLLANLFTEEEELSHTERYRRQMMDSISSVLPEALSKTLHLQAR